ncbi:ATP-binding cassette domain-containing protein [Allocoprobacillus halotolerans]|uniref:ATP-binding cassette domain-containing protein n=1 Tax=Allocoprobacillus halotolerans TaxID=2944914 RepID=A0ABY5I6G9_9FIRM|nr:ATP-binding cassette domain-containing protein [Allocoprobacillus halotolerans]UTY40670.1 ATP-binding cassette domain-containing protein [Allocoprobacillus halotolerans]
MLEVKNINISFQRNIFNNANIKFYDSCIHAIVGKSGSGKTTFLRSIIQDSSRVQMEISYNEEVISEKDEFVRKHIGYVDQLGSYFPNMSIKQHFSFYAKMKGEKISVHDINEFLSRVNLHHVNIKKSPSVLSIGERKRFLIALSLYCDKDIIILDEPTASLDKKNIALLKEVLLSLKDKTIILTTHTQEILEICDVVYRIENQQFECEKNDNDKSKKENKTHEIKNYRFSPIKYFQYKTPIQWIQLIGMIVISVFILAQSLPLIQSFLIANTINPQVTNQSSKEMIFLRNRSGQLYFMYDPIMDCYNSKPFARQELDKIEQLEGVKTIEKIDMFPLFNPSTYENCEKFEVIDEKGNMQTYEFDSYGSRAPAIYPYYKYNSFNDGDNGIYISSMLSKMCDIQEGDMIKAKWYIPKNQYIRNDNPYRVISYVLKEFEFKVTKVLKPEEEYTTPSHDMIVYIPYSMYNEILNSINQDDKEIMSSNVIRASEKVDPVPYTVDEYVIFVDEDYASDVYNAILEMDDSYDVYSTYMSYLDIDAMQREAFQTKLISTGGICGIGIIAFITIQYFLMKSRKEEIELLRNNGIKRKQIYQSILFENGVYFIVTCGIGLLLSYLYQSYIEDFTNVLLFSGVIIVISFVLLCVNVIVSQFILKKKKRVRKVKL